MGLDVGEIGMGLDLGLDLKLFAARSVRRFAASAAAAAAKEACGMDECIRSLEEERGKIEVFKRELPLCMRLLADVIGVLKEEVEKRRVEEEEKVEEGDKMKWMSTAQLWVDNRSRADADADDAAEKRIPSEKQGKESTSPERKGPGGAFVPFKAGGCGAPAFATPVFKRDEKAAATPGLPDLSLLSPAVKSSPLLAPVAAPDDRRRVVGSGFAMTSPGPALGLQSRQQQQQQQQARKSRRCWSPELHRQFVAALHQLGGAQVATPKQIRELMKVDGLTNDEVKSHLQKYRLHNRRAPGSAVGSQPIVLMGGLWVPQEQSSSQSGSPQGPLQFSGSGIAVSAATVGDSCEEEDGKSESYSWK